MRLKGSKRSEAASELGRVTAFVPSVFCISEVSDARAVRRQHPKVLSEHHPRRFNLAPALLFVAVAERKLLWFTVTC